MSAALQAYGAIWRATTVQRDRRTVIVMRWTTAALCAVAAVAIVVLLVRHQLEHGLLPQVVLRALGGIAAFWLTIMWAGLFVPASALLNSAANARLLPYQRRRLQQMAVAGWLLTTAGFALAIGSWAALPLVGLYLLGFALMRAGNKAAVALLVVSCNWPLLSRTLPPALVDALSSTAGVRMLTLVLLLAAAWGLRWLYPAGGDAYLDRRAEQVRRIASLNSGKWAGFGGTGIAARWGVLRVYLAALRRDCRGGYRRADPGRMLMHGLGPAGHWTTWLPALATLLVLGIAVRVAIVWSGGLDARLQAMASNGLGPLVIMILFSSAPYSQQLMRTRGEQALLRLAPLAGSAALLNRRLAGQLLRGALRNWACLTVSMLILVLLVGGDGGALLRQLGLCCLAGQVALMGVLCDYAAGGGWNLPLALRAGAVAALEAGVAVLLGLASGSVSAIWLWMIAIAGAATALLLQRGWRRMLAAPPAFPAGRLA